MDGRHVTAVASGATGLAVLWAVAHTLSGRGNYYAVSQLSVADPGLAELAIAGATLAGLGAVVVGVFSMVGYHPLATVGPTSLSLAILARPTYAHLAYGDVGFTAVCVLGAIAGWSGAMVVVVAEGCRYRSRWRRFKRRGDTTK